MGGLGSGFGLGSWFGRGGWEGGWFEVGGCGGCGGGGLGDLGEVWELGDGRFGFECGGGADRFGDLGGVGEGEGFLSAFLGGAAAATGGGHDCCFLVVCLDDAFKVQMMR